jgi:hypothetical protein
MMLAIIHSLLAEVDLATLALWADGLDRLGLALPELSPGMTNWDTHRQVAKDQRGLALIR